MTSAEELHRRGVVAMNAGKLGQATRLLQRARAATADETVRVRIDASLAYLAADAADLETALRLCEEALAAPGLPPEVRGVLGCQRAVIQLRSGRPALALASFGAAIADLDSMPTELAKAHLNRGSVHLDLADTEAAAEDFEAAALLFGQAGDDVTAAMALHNLGYARFLRGDLVSALDLMERAHRTLAEVSPVVRAVCVQDRAEVLLAAGLEDQGRDLLHQAADDYGRRRLRQRQGEAELALARSLLVHDPASAATAARRARRRFERLGSSAWASRAEGAELAAAVQQGGGAESLVAQGDRIAAALEAQGLVWAATAARLHAARVLVRRGQDEEVRRRLAGVRVGASAPLAVRLLCRDVRAERLAGRGRRRDALGHLRAGIDDLHGWQSTFGNLDLQTMVAGHGTTLGMRGLELALASRSPAVLFEWSERARMLASRVQPVRPPRDEELAADLAELRSIPAPQAPGEDAERREQLQHRVRQRAWQHQGSGEVSDPVPLDRLVAELGPGTALLSHVVAGGRVVALVVTDRGAQRVDLGERSALDRLLGGLLADLDMAGTDLPGAMAEMVRGALVERLRALAELLVAPALGPVADRRLVLTPSGALAGVPWTLLPGLVGRPVTVAQSATSWLARRTAPLRTATAGLVAGPRVDRAEQEVVAVAKEWPRVTTLVGAEAGCAAVSELAGSVDVLHVAAHGRHSAENPMFSGLELVDGPWFGYDIDQLPAVPDVVLLSACEVGRSSVRGGEELIGMTAAWLHAGSRCVVASSAAVSDEAAHRVLVAVHQSLAAGMDPAAALAAAVGPATADAPPAPFVCYS